MKLNERYYFPKFRWIPPILQDIYAYKYLYKRKRSKLWRHVCIPICLINVRSELFHWLGPLQGKSKGVQPWRLCCWLLPVPGDVWKLVSPISGETVSSAERYSNVKIMLHHTSPLIPFKLRMRMKEGLCELVISPPVISASPDYRQPLWQTGFSWTLCLLKDHTPSICRHPRLSSRPYDGRMVAK